MGCYNVTTNAGGIPYISTTNVAVGDTTVDLALGWRRNISPVGYFTVRVANEIPTGTTTTLPITLSMNGITRNLTWANGTAVTVADLENVSTMLIFNDRFNSVLSLMSQTAN